jgi:hypothetical protein
MHTSDTTAHVTQAERTAWDAKYDAEAATENEIGLVKPDGETLTVDENGTLSGIVVKHSDGSTAGPILSLTAKGRAEQDSTTGKNLLPITLENLKTMNVAGTWSGNVYTIGGITFTLNADGSITVNGNPTTTGNIPFYLGKNLADALSDGTYTLNGCPSGGSENSYKNTLHWMYGSTNNWTSQYGSDPLSFTQTDTRRILEVYIEVKNGYVCNNLVFYPQFELGSQATAYEPYTGGAPSPSPDYPQEIRVCRGHEVTGETGRFVDLVVKQGNTTLSTTPIPLPSRGWVASLPDGTADTLTLDGAGKVTWTLPTSETTQAVTDGVTGTVGVDVLSTTGQIADGATVLYKLALDIPATEELGGRVEMPEIPINASISIPELDDLGVDYIIPLPVVLQGYEDRIAALEAAIAELATS